MHRRPSEFCHALRFISLRDRPRADAVVRVTTNIECVHLCSPRFVVRIYNGIVGSFEPSEGSHLTTITAICGTDVNCAYLGKGTLTVTFMAALGRSSGVKQAASFLVMYNASLSSVRREKSDCDGGKGASLELHELRKRYAILTHVCR